MKLVFISASRVPSIAANSIQVMKVCQAFVQLGHDISLLLPKQDRPAAEFAKIPTPTDLVEFYGLQDSFPIEWLAAQPRCRRYDFAWRAIRRAKALQADAVYTWLPQSAGAALLARLPVLFELHEPPTGKIGPMLFQFTLRLSGKKRLLPITQALADICEKRYSVSRYVPNSDVVISPDAVDLERYQELPGPVEARRILGLAEAYTAGYTGHLYPGRGMGLLVELARRLPQIQFLWVGGRPETVRTWQARLAEEGLNNITLTGFVENQRLPLYQSAADVLLMPYEQIVTGSSGGNTADFSSPMKMFEYMACRRAILSSDLPVIHEVLNDRNALLCPPDDITAWERSLTWLKENPAASNALVRQAWDDVQRYTWIGRARRSLEGFLSNAD